MQEIRRYAQMVREIHMRPARRPEGDTVVLGNQVMEDIYLALEGNEVPHTKTVT